MAEIVAYWAAASLLLLTSRDRRPTAHARHRTPSPSVVSPRRHIHARFTLTATMSPGKNSSEGTSNAQNNRSLPSDRDVAAGEAPLLRFIFATTPPCRSSLQAAENYSRQVLSHRYFSQKNTKKRMLKKAHEMSCAKNSRNAREPADRPVRITPKLADFRAAWRMNPSPRP